MQLPELFTLYATATKSQYIPLNSFYPSKNTEYLYLSCVPYTYYMIYVSYSYHYLSYTYQFPIITFHIPEYKYNFSIKDLSYTYQFPVIYLSYSYHIVLVIICASGF
jgi:hypothetical protein